MLKQGLLASFIFLFSTSIAFAQFYLAPSLAYQNITGGGAQYSGIAPRIAVGYGAILRDALYLAGEIMVDPVSITVRNTQEGEFDMKEKYSIGASLLPGVDIDGTLLAYGRLGFVYMHFDKMDTTQPGYVAGIGLEYRIDEAWSARGEFMYIGYRSVQGATPRDQEGVIGIVYRFG